MIWGQWINPPAAKHVEVRYTGSPSDSVRRGELRCRGQIRLYAAIRVGTSTVYEANDGKRFDSFQKLVEHLIRPLS